MDNKVKLALELETALRDAKDKALRVELELSSLLGTMNNEQFREYLDGVDVIPTQRAL